MTQKAKDRLVLLLCQPRNCAYTGSMEHMFLVTQAHAKRLLPTLPGEKGANMDLRSNVSIDEENGYYNI